MPTDKETSRSITSRQGTIARIAGNLMSGVSKDMLADAATPIHNSEIIDRAVAIAFETVGRVEAGVGEVLSKEQARARMIRDTHTGSISTASTGIGLGEQVIRVEPFMNFEGYAQLTVNGHVISVYVMPQNEGPFTEASRLALMALVEGDTVRQLIRQLRDAGVYQL